MAVEMVLTLGQAFEVAYQLAVLKNGVGTETGSAAGRSDVAGMSDAAGLKKTCSMTQAAEQLWRPPVNSVKPLRSPLITHSSNITVGLHWPTPFARESESSFFAGLRLQGLKIYHSDLKSSRFLIPVPGPKSDSVFGMYYMIIDWTMRTEKFASISFKVWLLWQIVSIPYIAWSSPTLWGKPWLWVTISAPDFGITVGERATA